MIMGAVKCLNDFIKSSIFLQKFQLLIIGTVQIFKAALFFRKFQIVIIWADQIFKSHQQTNLLLAKILSPDNRGSSVFQVTSLNIGCLCEDFSS